jgi:hypothetical protein
MNWRKYCALFTVAFFLLATISWTAPPSAWAALLDDPVRIDTNRGDMSTSASATAQAGSFISLIHNSIKEDSTYNITFAATDGSGRNMTLSCSDTYDGYLRIQVPFMPDEGGVDNADTEVAVNVSGLPGSPTLMVEPPPTFTGDYNGQAMALLLEAIIQGYGEMAADLRAKAATGYASAQLNAAAASTDGYIAFLRTKLDAIQTHGILPVQETGGGAYSITPYGLSVVDNMLAGFLAGMSDECQARISFAETGQWPLKTMAKRKNMTAQDVKNSVNRIKNAWTYEYLKPWLKLGTAVFSTLIAGLAAWSAPAWAPFIGGAYALFLAWGTGLFDIAHTLYYNVTKKDGYKDTAWSVIKNGLNAAANMAGAAKDSATQWIANLISNGNNVYDGVKAYDEATGGGDNGGGGGGDYGDLTPGNILGTWSFNGWAKIQEHCIAQDGQITFGQNGQCEIGSTIGGKWQTWSGTYAFNNGYLKILDYGAGKISGNTRRFTVQFPSFCSGHTWTFYR